MKAYAVIGFVMVLFIISALVYVFVFAEKRNYPNNIARENTDFVTSTFDNNMPFTSKIQDFDIFKYSGFDIKNPLYTYTSKSSSNPYNSVATVSENPIESLNSTLLPDDIAVEMVDNALPVSGSEMDDSALQVSGSEIVDITPSLSGLNASTEASIRESMVKSELRRIRR